MAWPSAGPQCPPVPAEVMQMFSSRPEVQLTAMKKLMSMPEDQLGRGLRGLVMLPGGPCAFATYSDGEQHETLPAATPEGREGWGGAVPIPGMGIPAISHLLLGMVLAACTQGLSACGR